MRRTLLIIIWMALPGWLAGQIPAGYYNSAEGLTGKALQQALHDIIDNHTVMTYTQLWTCFSTTDVRADGTTIWDMYSDKPGGTPSYTYTISTDQCGNYSGEGDCYNREHSYPKSWFGGEVSPMYTDLFHLYPTDGYVNGQRSNLPFGETSSPYWTSTNGSMRGPSSVSGYSGEVFEPIDEYKGDFARSYFYMATRYYGEDAAWPTDVDMMDGSQPEAWALNMLLAWHRGDAVSSKEINRNNEVYKYQGNRNPFIDNPEYVEKIWGTLNATTTIYDNDRKLVTYPNPSTGRVFVKNPFEGCTAEAFIYDISGCIISHALLEDAVTELDVQTLKPGLYILSVMCDNRSLTGTFIIAGK